MTTGIDPEERRRPGRPRTLDRDAALLAARQVIAERGIERARYADVSAVAGVPVTTLQHAFGSLQGMLLEALRRATVRELDWLRARNALGTGDVWSRMQLFLTEALDTPEETHGASWLVWIELWRLVARDPAMAEEAAPVYAQWQDYMQELIRAGVESGEFTSALAADTVDASLAVNAVIDGMAVALILRAEGADPARALRVTLRTVADLLGCDAVQGDAAQG